MAAALAALTQGLNADARLGADVVLATLRGHPSWTADLVKAYFESSPHGFEFVRLLGEAGETVMRTLVLLSLTQVIRVHPPSTRRRVRNWAWALCRTHLGHLAAFLKDGLEVNIAMVDFFAHASTLDAGLAREIHQHFDFTPLAAVLQAGNDKKRVKLAAASLLALDALRLSLLNLVSIALETNDETCQRAALSGPLLAMVNRALVSKTPQFHEATARFLQALALCSHKLLSSAAITRVLYSTCLAHPTALALLRDSLKLHPQSVAPVLTLLMDPTESDALVPLGLECARALGVDEFLKQSRLALEPRDSPVWIAHASFCASVLDLPVPKGEETIASASTALKLALPSSLSRASLSRGLQHANTLVRLLSLDILESLLERARRVAQSLTSEQHRLFIAEVAKRVPDSSVLVGYRAYASQATTAEAKEAAEFLWCRALLVLQSFLALSPLLAEADVLKFLPKERVSGPHAALGAWAVALCVLESRPQPDDWLAGSENTVLGSLLRLGAEFPDASGVQDAVLHVACVALQDLGAVDVDGPQSLVLVGSRGARGGEALQQQQQQPNCDLVSGHAKALVRFGLASPENAALVDSMLRDFKRAGAKGVLPPAPLLPVPLDVAQLEEVHRGDVVAELWRQARTSVLKQFAMEAAARAPLGSAIFVLKKIWQTRPAAVFDENNDTVIDLLAATASAQLDDSPDAAYLTQVLEDASLNLMDSPRLDAVVMRVASVFPSHLLSRLVSKSPACLQVALARDPMLLLNPSVLWQVRASAPAFARVCQLGNAADLAVALSADSKRAGKNILNRIDNDTVRRLAMCPGLAAWHWAKAESVRDLEDVRVALRSQSMLSRQAGQRVLAGVLANDDDLVAAARFDENAELVREAMCLHGLQAKLCHPLAVSSALKRVVVGGDHGNSVATDLALKAMDAALDRKLADVVIASRRDLLSLRSIQVTEVALQCSSENETGLLLSALAQAGVPPVAAKTVQGKVVGWASFSHVLLQRGDVSAKLGLCEILLACTSVEPAKCASRTLLPLILAAYGASLSRADVLLRRLLVLYEAQGLSPALTAYAFGPWINADVLTMPSSLRPEAGQIGALLTQHGAWVLEAWDETSVRSEGALDPSYVLPCLEMHFGLYLLVADKELGEKEFPTRTWVLSGLVGFALEHTANPLIEVRKSAYAVLRRFAQLASRAGGFRERSELLLCLNALRQGISNPLDQIPGIVASFVGEALRVIARGATHPMWDLVVGFLLKKPALDLDDIPLFYTLFNSGSAQFEAERAWLLKILHRGVRGALDLGLLARRHVVEAAMALVDSPSGDPKSRGLVMKLFERIAAVDGGKRMLVRAGAVPWANHLLMQGLALKEAVWAVADDRHVDIAALLNSASRLLAAMGPRGALAERWALALCRLPPSMDVKVGVEGLLKCKARLSLSAVAGLIRRNANGPLLELVLASVFAAVQGAEDEDWTTVLNYALERDCVKAVEWIASHEAHRLAAGRLIPAAKLLALFDARADVSVQALHKVLASMLLVRAEPGSDFAREARSTIVPDLLAKEDAVSMDLLSVVLYEALMDLPGNAYRAMKALF